MLIQSQKLTIRYFEFEDLERFSQYRALPEISEFQSWEHYTFDDAKDLFKRMDYRQFGVIDSWWQLAIVKRFNNCLLGDLAVHFIDAEQVELGFTIAPPYQGQGIAYEAVNLLLDFLFNSLEKHRVVAITDTRNHKSVALLQRLGFRCEAHFKKNIFFKGEWGDEFLYAKLKSEHQASVS
ncbi:Putative ribosomal N-acetyltransferase YdaF [Thalassocella blandensis]|nr:Putative ribosomal N-acetyltransferase YdaF [Thalassocella blandensis]